MGDYRVLGFCARIYCIKCRVVWGAVKALSLSRTYFTRFGPCARETGCLAGLGLDRELLRRLPRFVDTAVSITSK